MDLNVLVFNVYAAVPQPVRMLGQHTRLQKMPAQLLKLAEEHEVDVFVLNECIAPCVQADLLEPLSKAGYRYCTSQISEKTVGTAHIVDGGIYILSKWPIMDQLQQTFRNFIGSDGLAAKGVSYASILKQKKLFHIIGTHLQAWDTPEGIKVRVDKQGNEIREFISALEIPKEEPLILAGDLNIDRNGSWISLQRFCHITQTTAPPVVGPERFTVSNQNQLYGNDEPMAYANEHWPNGCHQVFLETLSCVCCPNLWLDYALVSRAHQAPLPKTASMRAIPIRHDKPFRCQFSASVFREVRDLSDHYAVLATFQFPHHTKVEVEAVARSCVDEPLLPAHPEAMWLERSRKRRARSTHLETSLIYSPNQTLIALSILFALVIIALVLFLRKYRRSKPKE